MWTIETCAAFLTREGRMRHDVVLKFLGAMDTREFEELCRALRTISDKLDAAKRQANNARRMGFR